MAGKRTKSGRGTRYQVLADEAPIREVGTRKEAHAIAEQWRSEGKTNVMVWDTLRSPFSTMLH